MKTINVMNDGTMWFSSEVILDDRAYVLEFRWNRRMAAWFASISDSTGVLATSRIQLNVRLFEFVNPLLPAGVLYAYDVSGTGEEAGLTDLGVRVQIIYRSLSEL